MKKINKIFVSICLFVICLNFYSLSFTLDLDLDLNNVFKEDQKSLITKFCEQEQEDSKSSNKKYLLLLLGLFSFAGIGGTLYCTFSKMHANKSRDIAQLKEECFEQIKEVQKETIELKQKVLDVIKEDLMRLILANQKDIEQSKIQTDAINKKMNEYFQCNAKNLQEFEKEMNGKVERIIIQIKEQISEEGKKSRSVQEKHCESVEKLIKEMEDDIKKDENKGFFSHLFSMDGIDFSQSANMIRNVTNLGKTVENIVKIVSEDDSSDNRRTDDLEERMERLNLRFPSVPKTSASEFFEKNYERICTT
ncbi:MAG: hypothetical protein WC436_01755 [Candidatus Babeliales bacterium]